MLGKIVEAYLAPPGVVPLIKPVDHAEEVGGGDPGVQAGTLLWSKLFDQLVDRLEIGAAALVNGVIGLPFKGFQFPGANLELMHVLAEVADMVAHGGPETQTRLEYTFEATVEALEQGVEGVVLDPVE